MNIDDIAKELLEEFERQSPSINLENEAAFERKHVIDPAWELSRKHPEIQVFVHPEKRDEICQGGCNAGIVNFSNRVRGCPDCWENSKKWSVAKAFGTKNNFDLVAIDQNNRKLAVEVKWLPPLTGRRPNSDSEIHRSVRFGICCPRCNYWSVWIQVGQNSGLS